MREFCRSWGYSPLLGDIRHQSGAKQRICTKQAAIQGAYRRFAFRAQTWLPRHILRVALHKEPFLCSAKNLEM